MRPAAMCAAAFVLAVAWGIACAMFGIDGFPFVAVVFVLAIFAMVIAARGYPYNDTSRPAGAARVQDSGDGRVNGTE